MSAVLEMLNATPQERAALQQIAALRSAGVPDDQIFSGLAADGFTQGGGSGYLPYALDAAQLASSDRLGRGNLALAASEAEYARAANPFNVVSALQYMRDSGDSALLGDPMLNSVQPGPASAYQQYLQGLMGGSTPSAAAPSGGAASGTTAPAPAAPTAQPTTSTGQQWIDAWRAYHPGEQDPVPGYATNAVNTGAQQASSRLLGSTLGGVGVGSTFKGALDSGGVPGFNSINERNMGLMSGDQQQSYMGIVGSTGRVSDPRAAYAQYSRLYGHR